MEQKKVPLVVIRRLPRYYRYLSDLNDMGIERISSQVLSKKLGFTASQVRQDLNFFGGFGQQGYGYNVKSLRNEISKILGLDKHYKVVVIGAGNLGHAILNYPGFAKRGFKFVGIFDNNPDLIGKKAGNLTVMNIDDLEEFCEKDHPDIGALTIPKESTANMAKKLEAFGFKGLWNFSHVEITSSLPVETVHLTDSLMTLAYKISSSAVDD
ncbi:MAG: redox-sensing transcriptional repressor Rex [Bacillota bacterium]|nr:redox-sensing transcriptional repressor Rex [Bacillota bacterium]